MKTSWLRQAVLDAGADDVGFVALDRPELDDQRPEILGLSPWTKALISIVCKMNREPDRSPARSVANLEFHHAGDRTNEVAHRVVAELEAEGVRADNPAMGFSTEMDRFPGKIVVVSHKPDAVAAGLGRMGIHRNVNFSKALRPFLLRVPKTGKLPRSPTGWPWSLGGIRSLAGLSSEGRWAGRPSYPFMASAPCCPTPV